MDSTALQQLKKVVKNKNNIVVVSTSNKDSDVMCAALAFCGFLKNKQKNVSLFYSTKPTENLVFIQKKAGACEAVVVVGYYKKNKKYVLCGVVAKTLISIDEKAITPLAASCLLTGIVSKTQNFRHTKTKPHHLFMSSYLTEKGADNQRIVKDVYNKKTLAFVRLWAEATANIKVSKNKQFCSSYLTIERFKEQSTNITKIIDELKKCLPTIDTYILTIKHTRTLKTFFLIHSTKNVFLKKIEEANKNNVVAKSNNTVVFLRSK